MSFCKWFFYPSKFQSLSKHAKNKKENSSYCKKAFLHIRVKASYTLEMAVVLPLVAAFLTSVLFFFRVLQVQTQVQAALVYTSREVAAEASMIDSQAALLASAEALVRKELKNHREYQRYVGSKALGISLIGSDLSGPEIVLRADYFVKLPIQFFKIRGVHISQASVSRKWTGDNDRWNSIDYVYITEHGTVYHECRNCKYLDLSIRMVEYAEIGHLRNENKHKYSACNQCVANNKHDLQVYITNYGTCYHSSLSCSGLKRTVYLVPKSDVGNKGPCSKCTQANTGGK